MYERSFVRTLPVGHAARGYRAEIYQHYFGNYDAATVAYIASAGKWLAATTVAAIVDEGKLGWDDKVKKWLPEFRDTISGKKNIDRKIHTYTTG